MPLHTNLFPPGLVTDGGPQQHPVWGGGQQTLVGTNQDAQTRLLQDGTVVIVGVAHGPAAHVMPSCLVLHAV